MPQPFDDILAAAGVHDPAVAERLREERAARDTVIRDSISDMLGRALAGYTEDYKLIENGQTYIRWGDVQDAIRALFGKEHPVADVMNHNRQLQHELNVARARIEWNEKTIARLLDRMKGHAL